MTATVVLVLRFLLAAVLYFFLWRALSTLWQELKQQGTILSAQKKAGIHINARSEDGREYKLHFWQTAVVIGRGTNCDVSLNDEAVSAHHAQITYHHGQWWLEDLGSTNGTYLNMDQISVPTVIITGDEFKCGNTVFTLRMDPVQNNTLARVQE